MKFFATPNLSVYKKIRQGRKIKQELACKFDENGEYETNDVELIKKLKIYYKYEETEAKLRKCKLCEFTCENQGELLAHYRKSHPKEG